jgi:hypothetical protein
MSTQTIRVSFETISFMACKKLHGAAQMSITWESGLIISNLC